MVQLSVTIPRSFKRTFRGIARSQKLNMSQMVTKLMREYLVAAERVMR